MFRHTREKEGARVRVLGQFESERALIVAAKALRERGEEGLEAHTPFPIHDLDEILEVRPTKLPWIALLAGVSAGVAAIAFQWWTNAVDYPFIVSGKPRFSLPANIPVTFEVVILAAALTVFGGMILLTGLPKLANPLLRSERFARATNDAFFLTAETTSDEAQIKLTTRALQNAGAIATEVIADDDSPPRLPRSVGWTIALLAACAMIPPAWIASVRGTRSEKPRLHNFFDMDFQPKFKAQTASSLFADGRSMRPQVPGTIARGQLVTDPRVSLGREPNRVTTPKPPTLTETPFLATGLEASEQWVSQIPVDVTSQLMERGKLQYEIHCAVCHGLTGAGNGLASLRALELEQGTWVPPTSLHADHVREQPVGQLFNTITHGIRKMPAYGSQIKVEDRWSIVLYLKALQRSQNASVGDVPDELRDALRDLN